MSLEVMCCARPSEEKDVCAGAPVSGVEPLSVRAVFGWIVGETGAAVELSVEGLLPESVEPGVANPVALSLVLGAGDGVGEGVGDGEGDGDGD